MRHNSEITITFDFDGVICANNKGSYADAPPFQYSIDAINKAYDLGYNIIICTARYGQRHPGKQYQFGYEEALAWLKKHGVKFHELHMGKPPGDIYVDDKGCKVDAKNGTQEWDKFWTQLKELNNKNQYNQIVEPTHDTDSYNYSKYTEENDESN